MSLNISAEGMAYNGTKVAGTTAGLAALTSAAFDSGSDFEDASSLVLWLDNSGTPSSDIITDLPAPSALGVVGGVRLTLVNDTTGKKVTAIDPNTGYTLDYVNRQGESISLVSDEENDQWIIAF